MSPEAIAEAKVQSLAEVEEWSLGDDRSCPLERKMKPRSDGQAKRLCTAVASDPQQSCKRVAMQWFDECLSSSATDGFLHYCVGFLRLQHIEIRNTFTVAIRCVSFGVWR
jgi:hypothetical protein